MFVFYEQATRRSSTLPPFQITETPSPVRHEAPRERGNHVFGANPPLSGGGAGSFRASPTANPVGRRRRSVCFRTPISSRRGLAASQRSLPSLCILPRRAPRQLRRRRRLARRNRHLHPDAESAAARQRDADPAQVRPAPRQGRDRGRQQDPHQALHLRRRPRQLVGPRLRLLGLGQLRAARRRTSSTARSPRARWPSWGSRGEGRWITVYANAGHAYAVIAGYPLGHLRRRRGETGPRWHADLRDNVGYVARHPRRLLARRSA